MPHFDPGTPEEEISVRWDGLGWLVLPIAPLASGYVCQTQRMSPSDRPPSCLPAPTHPHKHTHTITIPATYRWGIRHESS